mmetsp:Transcript_835/g.2059  ORF Transcript_835/g.2059 Transcript_835/m.2059 type:complete len:81 (+) Transcript_835:959-1201(+)
MASTVSRLPRQSLNCLAALPWDDEANSAPLHKSYPSRSASDGSEESLGEACLEGVPGRNPWEGTHPRFSRGGGGAWGRRV